MLTRSTATWPRVLRKGDFEEHRAILTALFEMAGGHSCIDLGCGEAHVTQHFSDVLLVDEVVRNNPTAPVFCCDMRKAVYMQNVCMRHFDLGVMTDSIEHLSRSDAMAVLKKLSGFCNAIAIFTPVGPWHLDPTSTDPDAHKSAWYPEEFSVNGWAVVEYPTYHRFEAGEILGAFWAWKFMREATPTPAEVFARANLPTL